MDKLPKSFYLRRKDVLLAVRGRRRLEAHVARGALHPVYLPGYRYAKYLRSEVVSILTELAEGSVGG